MSQVRIVLTKTPKDRLDENPKRPYFRLVLPPEEDGGEWVDIGALWKAKSGNGYSGTLAEGIEIVDKREPKEGYKENAKDSATDD